ncbi:MAG TPA: glycosyltransferase family 2 protein [Myxococcota bacterium]|nr:glycosyltransferase family 2 protein [Myxococcota bacterium]
MSERPVLLLCAYQEATRIGDVLDAVAQAAPGYERLVVDDGSSDATADVARRHGAHVVRHPFNLGYGAALQTGYKYARAVGAPWLVQMDADGQHDPSGIASLAEPIERGELDLVVGSRFLFAGPGDAYAMGPVRTLGRRVFSGVSSAFGLSLTDPTSGFQALGPHALALYVGDFFPCDFPDVDVLLVAHRHGLRVGERPVHMWQSRRPSTLHSGWAPIYYVYKMSLSTWAASRTVSGGREGSR